MSGSGATRFAVPGTQPSRNGERDHHGLDRAGRAQRMAGEALGGAHGDGGGGRSPRPAAIARASAMSPIGVEEAWALTQSMSAGADRGVGERDP